jgi:hypothetical protein
MLMSSSLLCCACNWATTTNMGLHCILIEQLPCVGVKLYSPLTRADPVSFLYVMLPPLFCYTSATSAQAVSSSGRYLLLGGEGVQPSIWDLAAGSKLWQAKGGKPHRQTLLVDKPFTTAVAFLPDSSSSSSDGASTQQTAAAVADEEAEDAAAAVKLHFVAGSASSKVAVYDTAAGRRPQKEVVFGETRVTALAPEQDGECFSVLLVSCVVLEVKCCSWLQTQLVQWWCLRNVVYKINCVLCAQIARYLHSRGNVCRYCVQQQRVIMPGFC